MIFYSVSYKETTVCLESATQTYKDKTNLWAGLYRANFFSGLRNSKIMETEHKTRLKPA